jgi:hypothetical protein
MDVSVRLLKLLRIVGPDGISRTEALARYEQPCYAFETALRESAGLVRIENRDVGGERQEWLVLTPAGRAALGV